MRTRFVKGIDIDKFSSNGDMDCAICQCPIQDGNGCIDIGCAHFREYHTACIVEWIKAQGSTCPLCRGAMRLKFKVVVSDIGEDFGEDDDLELCLPRDLFFSPRVLSSVARNEDSNFIVVEKI